VAANKENKSRVAGHCLSQGKTLPTPNLIKKEDKRVSYTFAGQWIGIYLVAQSANYKANESHDREIARNLA